MENWFAFFCLLVGKHLYLARRKFFSHKIFICYVCVSAYFISFFVCPSVIYFYVCLVSLSLYLRLSELSISRSLCHSIRLSICLSGVWLSVSSACFSFCQSVFLPPCLSIHEKKLTLILSIFSTFVK